MSNYYKYNFVSPEPLYAKVKEEFKSYFDTGVIDDLLFPIWTEDALRDLSKASLPISETVLYLDDYSATLPPGFESVREAWLCTESAPISIRKPGAYYSQVITLLNPDDDPCTGDPCIPRVQELIYKTTTDELYRTSTTHLLMPGTVHAISKCGENCPNVYTDSTDRFEIRDGKFHTNFRTGDVYLKFYSKDFDKNYYQLIPDNRKIQQYLEAYLKCKLMEALWNTVTDETFNQIERKYQLYEQKKVEAYGGADVEIKKQTVYQKRDAIIRQNHRFDRFIIK